MTSLQQPFTHVASISRRRHQTTPRTPSDPALQPSDDVFVLESCHSTWIFDPPRLRFRRILRGVEVGDRRVVTDWRPYWQLEVDPEGEGFTVYLNSSRSRLIRSWRHGEDCSRCSRPNADDLPPGYIHLAPHGVVADARERSPSR